MIDLSTQEQQDIQRIVDLGKYTTTLLILFRLNRPVYATDIARLSGIHPQTIRSYLHVLAEMQYVTQSRVGWILTAGGRQLVLPSGQEPNAKISRLNSPETTDNAKISRSIVSSSSSSFKTLNSKRIDSEGKEEEESRATRNFRVANAKISRSGEINSEILDAFRDAGISLNKRTRQLAGQEWITPNYVRAHHAALEDKGKGNATGLLITILESGEPAPDLADKSLGSIICPDCNQYPCHCE